MFVHLDPTDRSEASGRLLTPGTPESRVSAQQEITCCTMTIQAPP